MIKAAVASRIASVFSLVYEIVTLTRNSRLALRYEIIMMESLNGLSAGLHPRGCQTGISRYFGGCPRERAGSC